MLRSRRERLRAALARWASGSGGCWSFASASVRGAESESLEEIGRELGLTRERIRQLETRGLKQLEKILGREAALV